jgi:hypothetical protein
LVVVVVVLFHWRCFYFQHFLFLEGRSMATPTLITLTFEGMDHSF